MMRIFGKKKPDDVIIISTSDGEEICTISGELASDVINFAVTDFIRRSLLQSVALSENRQVLVDFPADDATMTSGNASQASVSTTT